MIGKWQGDWQGQWQGATGATGAPGSMSATGSLVISGFGTLQARVTIVPPPVEEAGGGGARWVDEYLEEQQRIADKIRSQNQAIVAMVVSLAISEGAE